MQHGLKKNICADQIGLVGGQFITSGSEGVLGRLYNSFTHDTE